MKLNNLFVFLFALFIPQILLGQTQKVDDWKQTVDRLYEAEKFEPLNNYYKAVDEVKCMNGSTNWCNENNIYQLHKIAGVLYTKKKLFSDKNIRKDMVEYEKAIRTCNDTSSMNSSPCKKLIDLKLSLWGIYSSDIGPKKNWSNPQKKKRPSPEVERTRAKFKKRPS